MAVEKKEKKMLIDKLKPRTEDAAPTAIPPERMEMVDVIQLAADMLKEEGVEYVLAISGHGCWPMETFAQKAGIPRIHPRHEQFHTFAADGWARLTRRPTMVPIVGVATANCNATPGLVQGYAANSPFVVIQAGLTMGHRDIGSAVNPENNYRKITKSVEAVHDPNMFLYYLKKAFRSVVTHPTGPCVVAYSFPGMHEWMGTHRIPRMAAEAFYTPGFWAPRVWKTQADPELVEKSLRWLLEAERPAMVVGHAIHQDDAQEELREFVHLLGIPCHARRIARGAISEYDPLNAYGRARGAVMRGSDRSLVMGLMVGFLENYGQPPFWGTQTRYIQAQPSPEMLDLVLATEYELIGNMKVMLRQFIDCAKDLGIKGPLPKWEKWRQFVADTKTSYEKPTLERTEKMRGKMPLHPDLAGRLAAEFFRDEYQDDYIPIIDGFTASSYFTDWNKMRNSGMILDAGDTIGMGHGFGMALAAGLATKREKPIFVVLGDGAVGIGGMDIETVSRWNIPAVFFLENNAEVVCGGWDLLLANAVHPTGNHLLDAWETLPNLRHDRMFAEFGCHPEFVEHDEQLKPALKRACDFAMREKKPAFIECHVDPEALQEIWVGMASGFSRYANWDELPEAGQEAILEYGLVPRQSLPMLNPTWRKAILAHDKQQKG